MQSGRNVTLTTQFNLLPKMNKAQENILTRSIFSALICIKCIKKQRNTLNYTDILLLRYFHLHVSASNPAIFRVTLLLQEYSVSKCVKLFNVIEIHRLLVRIF